MASALGLLQRIPGLTERTAAVRFPASPISPRAGLPEILRGVHVGQHAAPDRTSASSSGPISATRILANEPGHLRDAPAPSGLLDGRQRVRAYTAHSGWYPSLVRGRATSTPRARLQMPQERQRQKRHVAGHHERHGAVRVSERRVVCRRAVPRPLSRRPRRARRAGVGRSARGPTISDVRSSELPQHRELPLEDACGRRRRARSCRGRPAGGRGRRRGSRRSRARAPRGQSGRAVMAAGNVTRK